MNSWVEEWMNGWMDFIKLINFFSIFFYDIFINIFII